MKFPKVFAAAAAAAVIAAPAQVEAQDLIVSAVSGVINSGGNGFGSLTETLDQSGLSTGYTSGVTLFDTFIASGPTHTFVFSGNEWFSNQGTTAASVTYNLGSVMDIGRMALWNEESAGIGSLDLFGSVNGTDFFSLAMNQSPTDNSCNTTGCTYGADVFGWTAQSLQYVRMDMSDCPQFAVDSGSSFSSCAIGEVAFANTVSVPEPASALLMLTGLVGLGIRSRRREEDAA